MATNIVEMERARGVLRPTTPCLPPALSRLLHGLTRTKVLRRSLTAPETETLAGLLPAYRAYLEPGPRDDISGLLTRLRGHYFVPDMSPGMAKALADDWADDLGGYPLWAVKAACDRYRRGEPTRAPKPANIIAFAEEEIDDKRQEMREVERALSAKPAEPEPVPATREQVAAILEKHGHQKMVDEAKAEKAKPKPRHSVHDRAAAAAMETFHRQYGEEAPAPEEQAAEAGGA